VLLDRLLARPAAYSRLSALVGGGGRARYVRDHVRPVPGMRILDIGCGTGDVVDVLPADVHYVGLDASRDYIDRACARYGARGDFVCAPIDARMAPRWPPFDLVMANGVVHHLDDAGAADLFALARAVLRPEGRLVTIDGCYVPGQSAIARFLLSRDRGRFVRAPADYERLARAAFARVDVTVRHDLIRVPYTHLIMECRP
jgi:SAM-dependent methyltransferase